MPRRCPFLVTFNASGVSVMTKSSPLIWSARFKVLSRGVMVVPPSFRLLRESRLGDGSREPALFHPGSRRRAVKVRIYRSIGQRSRRMPGHRPAPLLHRTGVHLSGRKSPRSISFISSMHRHRRTVMTRPLLTRIRELPTYPPEAAASGLKRVARSGADHYHAPGGDVWPPRG
jgi:hypothetical protein